MWADMMTRGSRVYGGSEMAAVLHGEGIPQGTIEALLASTTPTATCYGGSRPMMNFETGSGARGSTTTDRPLLPHIRAYSPPMLMMNDSDLDDYTGYLDGQHQFHTNQSDSKKRRLSPDQVQFLEKSFEADNKLEPERKVELARSLGLQPRQVAIWFQNRRARWRTKQLERDYEAVRDGYEGLKRDFDAARKDKEKLEAEVNYLREQLLNRQKRRRGSITGVDTTAEIQPASITQEWESKTSCTAEEVPALPKQEEMFTTLPQEVPTETDHSGLSHVADDEGLDGVVAAATTCRYDFPTGIDDHHPLWLWQHAEFCGP